MWRAALREPHPAPGRRLVRPATPACTSHAARAPPPCGGTTAHPQSDNDGSGSSSSEAAAAAPQAPPAAREQADEVEAAEQAPLSEGDKVYLVEAEWFSSWCQYTGYEPPRSPPRESPPAAAAAAAAAPVGPGAASVSASAAGSPSPAPGRVDNRALLDAGGGARARSTPAGRR